MPRKPIDYSKLIIYKIVCNDLDVKYCYVGHTTDFKNRKRQHKQNTTNEDMKNYHLKVYQAIRDNGGWENWDMIEIEKYPCQDINAATARERYWYEVLNANLNCVVPNRTQKEHYEQNKQHFKEYKKNWYENHKEETLEHQKQKYLTNKETICQQRKEIYEIQKHIRTNCECGGNYNRYSKANHLLTKQHKYYIINNNLNNI